MAEMEMLKRARFGLEKLRALCERVLRREKDKRREAALQTELWAMQARGMDDGGDAETARSPPPSPSRVRVWMTARTWEAAEAALPEGYAFEREDTGA